MNYDYYNVVENIIGMILLSLLLLTVSFLFYLIARITIIEPKIRESCKNHLVIASYSKIEDDLNVVPITSVNHKGYVTTSTVLVPEDNVYHYMKLDDGTSWKISSEDYAFPPSVGDKSDEYCKYASKIK